MKKILIMLFVVVVLLCSCGKQENPTETDAPGESEPVPVSEQTEPTPAPTEQPDEPLIAEEVFADYRKVYVSLDVKADNFYGDYCNETKSECYSNPDAPRDPYAMIFEDLDNVGVLMQVQKDVELSYSDYESIVLELCAYGQHVDFNLLCTEEHLLNLGYGPGAGNLKAGNGVLCYTSGYDDFACFLWSGGYDTVEASQFGEDRRFYTEFTENNEWKYSVENSRFIGMHDASRLTDQYRSADEFMWEKGDIIFENGKITLSPIKQYTVGDWYQTDFRGRIDSCATVEEYMALYHQYVEEGREDDFFALLD